MISVIICSTNAERCARVKGNISATIGCDHEFVVRDNRGTSDGLCKVYNELASEASGDYYCFVHEDVEFLTHNWGATLIEQAALEQTGIVGVVGCAMKTRTLSGMMHKHYGESNIIDADESKPIPTNYRRYSLSGLDMAPAVIVDGVLLVMRREVFWKIGGFDDMSFKGFHLYDMDISTAATVAGYTNYICHTIKVAHFSRGSYSQAWLDESQKYNDKWNNYLPLYINRPCDKQIAKDERYIFFNITYHLMKRRAVAPDVIWPRVKEQLAQYPWAFKSYYHYYRYLRYRSEFKNK